MIDLFIENYRADVKEDLSALLTFAIDDITDFGSRNTTFSKTIVMPGTARNNDIFGNIFDFGSGNFYDATQPNVKYNFNASVSAKAIIFQNNIQVFKGVVRLLEIIVDNGVPEYEVAVFGQLGGLVAKMGNKKIEALDFSAYDQVYSLSGIVSSWDNPGGSGVFYPLIDYGTYSTDKHSWDYHTFRPALYVKEYIDKIFASAGFTYNCNLFNTPRFKSLVVPQNKKILTRLTSNVFSASRTTTATVISSGGPIGPADYPFETVSGTLFTIDATKTKITFIGSSPINANINIDLRGTINANGCSITGKLKKNGIDIAFKNFGQTGPVTIGMYWTVTVPTTLAQNDVLEFEFSSSDSTKTYLVQATAFSPEFTITTVVPTEVPITFGDTITMNYIIPKNHLQKDFFASILKLFNLYVYEDQFKENFVNIAPYVDYYDNNPANALDWTSKLDRSRPISIKPMSELNSRYYEFAFKSDSDYWNNLYQTRYNQNYGELKYDSAFEFAQEVNRLELIFSSTPLVGYPSEDKVYSTIFKRSGTTEETLDSNIRLLQSKKVTGVNSWDIKDGATVLGSYTYYGYAGHLDDPNAPANDINFGVPKELFFTLVSGGLNVNQFNVYWSPYMAEITDKDSKLVTADFRLLTKDVFNLDFSKMIYLDGVLFRLNKIIDYNATQDDTCKVSLLKVIDVGVGSGTVTDKKDQSYTYVGSGTEGKTLTIGAIQGYNIIILAKGNNWLQQVSGAPTVNQFSFNRITGVFTFGSNINANQIIQFIYN